MSAAAPPPSSPTPDGAPHGRASELDPDARRLLAAVRSIVTELSDGRGLGRLDLDVSLERELGLGSLERVELVARIESAFGIRLSADAFGSVDTPRQLLALVRSAGIGGAEANRSRSPAAQGAQGIDLLPQRPPVAEPVEASTLLEVLQYHVRTQPDRVHIVLRGDDGEDRPITYADLHRGATNVAASLRKLGLQPGRCVALMLPTEFGYFAAFLGTLMAGGIPVPLYPPVRLDRIAEYVAREALILANAEAQILVTFERAAAVAQFARDRVPSIEHVVSIDRLLTETGEAGLSFLSRVSAEDTALIQYTSGSTGDPKGVELTHRNVLSNVRASREGCALGPDDVLVSWLPLYHDMGLVGGWLMCFYFGVPTVLMSPMTFLARPQRWLEALSDFRASCSVAPNFAFELCTHRVDDEVIGRLDLRRVRAVLNGSEPILPSTLDRFAERFAAAGFRRQALFCAYGLAENMVAVSFPPVGRAPRVDRIDRAVFEAEGRAVPVEAGVDGLEFVGVGSAVRGTEIRMVDDRGEPIAERRQGRIQFRGTSAFKGYYKRPDATAAVKSADGWVDTGDLGYFADGELFITGRSKDIIIKGGRNYYPHEFEAATAEVEGLRKGCAAAFAVRDVESGTEQVVVVVETRETDAAVREALIGRAREAIVRHVGIPADRIVLIAPGALPKTSSGKIRRSEAKRRFLAGALDEAHGSFAKQAVGLYLRSAPTRIAGLARRAAATVYGGYAIGTLAAACGVTPLVGRVLPAGRSVRRMARAQARAALTATGLRPRVIGLSRLQPGAAVLVANHCGYLDFLLCTAALPVDTRYVIKGELRDQPYLGPFLARTGHVFIDRHVAARSIADLEAVKDLLARGERVLIFPEGTFSPELGMRPFKLGAFRLACEAGVPVVPIAIRGSRKALRDGTWLPRHVPLEIEVLEPIAPNGREIADIVRLRDQAADAIAARIDEPRLFAADISVPGGAASS